MLEEAKFAHGAIAAAALVLISLGDIRLFSSYFKPLSDEVFWQLRLTVTAIPWLVLGLWISGGLLLSSYSDQDPGFLVENTALQAKIVLAIVLSFSGLMLYRTVLKHIQPGMVLAESGERLWIGLQGITSSSLWLMCGLLGVFHNLHLGVLEILGWYWLAWATLALILALITYYAPFFNILAAAFRSNSQPQ